jgi:hypothetical protein
LFSFFFRQRPQAQQVLLASFADAVFDKLSLTSHGNVHDDV